MQNTHIARLLPPLHEALIDLVGFFNRPQNDAILVREAGVSLDRALFPLLVRIQRRGPLGVGELADLVGRDYTTVSRQVAVTTPRTVGPAVGTKHSRIRPPCTSAHGPNTRLGSHSVSGGQ